MSRIKKPDREFVYLSPLKDCKNENAKQLASLVESFMLENINLQLEFIECRAKQIYDYVSKLTDNRE